MASGKLAARQTRKKKLPSFLNPASRMKCPVVEEEMTERVSMIDRAQGDPAEGIEDAAETSDYSTESSQLGEESITSEQEQRAESVPSVEPLSDPPEDSVGQNPGDEDPAGSLGSGDDRQPHLDEEAAEQALPIKAAQESTGENLEASTGGAISGEGDRQQLENVEPEGKDADLSTTRSMVSLTL